MIIVSDNTATDLLFDKVGGVDPVNALMRSYGLNATRATAPASEWFQALRDAGSAAALHRAGKHPFGLSSPRDIGKALEMMLRMMRGQVYSSRLPKFDHAHIIGDKRKKIAGLVRYTLLFLDWSLFRLRFQLEEFFDER